MAKLQAFELLVCPLPELAMCSLNMAKLLAFEILVCPPPELDMCSLNQVFIDLVRRHHTYTTVGLVIMCCLFGASNDKLWRSLLRILPLLLRTVGHVHLRP
jgi:hypothetical protein